MMKEIKELVKHLILHNGWLKLIAIVISLLLWAGLISQDPTLTREKTFNNVNVTVSGAETMKRNGLIVTSDMTELLKDVTMTAAVPQQQYNNAEVTHYNPRVDLSKITSEGTQEIRIVTSTNATYGRVVSLNPSTVTVEVDQYMTRTRIPVAITVEGKVPEGWVMSPSTADPALVTVSGPASLVGNIARAKVVLNTSEVDWKEGLDRVALPFTLYDRNGEPVENELIVTTSESVLIDSVIVEQNISKGS